MIDQNIRNPLSTSSVDGYIDISVEEAWTFLNDTSNGIQIPIDVRTDNEWISDHIDTPSPENPKHHNYNEWGDPDILNQFLTTYQGKEIIVYCRSGGRSVSASNILVDNNFNGIIYNMVGGITAWRSAGLPTTPNRIPDKPTIEGPSQGSPGENIEFTVSTHDLDEDNLFYRINWSDGSDEQLIGPYQSGENVKINHTWTEIGIYPIHVKARDTYNYESDWSVFEFSVSKTELEISEIRGGFGTVSIDIKNTGDFVAEEVSSMITVKGGLFSKINLTHTCAGCSVCGNTLDPGEIKTESTRESGLLLGIGTIEVNVSAWAKNAEEVKVQLNGIIIGLLVLISD
jgi:rhodanese-related sulfurtransferase